MSLTPGSRLGPYEVIAKVGEGGPPSLVGDENELRRGLAVAQLGSTW